MYWGRVCSFAVHRKLCLSALRRSDHLRVQCTDHEQRLQHLLPFAKKHKSSLEQDRCPFFGVLALAAMSYLKSEVDLWYNWMLVSASGIWWYYCGCHPCAWDSFRRNQGVHGPVLRL